MADRHEQWFQSIAEGEHAPLHDWLAISHDEDGTAKATTAPESVNTVSDSGSSLTLDDLTTATVDDVTLTAACTLTFPTAAAGASFTLVLRQDGTGSRTVTWPSGVRWAAGSAPTLTTTASAVDVLAFLCVDGTHWLGFVSGQDMR